MNEDVDKRSLLHGVFVRAQSQFGKSAPVDAALPTSFLARSLLRRVAWVLRGLLRCRGLVFVGPRVEFRHKSAIELGAGVTIEEHAVVDGFARGGVKIGARTKIGAYCRILSTTHVSLYGHGVEIGEDCSLGAFGFVGAAGGVRIGSNVIMGEYVSFHSQNHEFGDPAVLIRLQGTTEEGIVIGENCWIGAKATFLDGVELGAGSVVAAGAVVAESFPPRSVIGGVPARALHGAPSMASTDNP